MTASLIAISSSFQTICGIDSVPGEEVIRVHEEIAARTYIIEGIIEEIAVVPKVERMSVDEEEYYIVVDKKFIAIDDVYFEQLSVGERVSVELTGTNEVVNIN